MYFQEGDAVSHETSWDVLMTVSSAGASGFMNLLLFKQVRWGFFSLSSTILSCLTLKCNSLLLLIEQCSYLHVSLWHNQWNNLNISYTDFTFFREAIEPFVLWFYIWGILFSGIVLPHRVDGNCCCQRQPYSSSWFFESISALFQLFF